MDNRCTRFWAVLAAFCAMLAAVAFFMEGGGMNTRRNFVRGLTGIAAVKQLLGWTDEKVAQVLASAEIGGAA